jgi:hypothetical protein
MFRSVFPPAMVRQRPLFKFVISTMSPFSFAQAFLIESGPKDDFNSPVTFGRASSPFHGAAQGAILSTGPRRHHAAVRNPVETQGVRCPGKCFGWEENA